MKYIFLLLIISSFGTLRAQEVEEAMQVVDSLYREDQFYIGVSFNLLRDKPSSLSQTGFSGGLQTGFIRDMPINKNRTRAIGIGLGLALDSFNQNLFIVEGEDSNDITYEIITSDINEDTNRFTYYTLELPIEYRWRMSTPTNYSFWRIHAGVRMGYIFSFKSTFEDADSNIVIRDVPELNELQYGLTLSFGYGAFNFQGYYGLSTLFDNQAKLESGNVDLKVLRLGLQFFFL